MFNIDEDVVTGQVEADIPLTPDDFRMKAYPNPFNATVRIAFNCNSLEKGNPGVEVEIFDLNGRLVKTLDSHVRVNENEIVWRPKNNLPSGVYFVKSSNGSLVLSNKVVYLK